ncbi:MAG: alpha/beta fold hydrolase [Bryobacteraceae bacterium]
MKKLCLAALIIAVFFLASTFPRYRREMAAAKARVLARSAILNTNRVVIEYAVAGEGPAVLTLHGAGGGYDQGLWAARMALGEGYKLIAVSRYGYLRTPIPPRASVRMQAAAYGDLLDHLRIRKVIVLGCSAGGPPATQFANDYPARAAALILMSAVSEASLPGDKPSFYTGVMHSIQRSDYAYWLVARFFQGAILNLVGVPPNLYASFSPLQKQLAREMLDAMHPMSLRYRGTLNDGEMIRREPVSKDRVSAPVLIVHSRDDALVSYGHAERAHQAIRHSRLITFETGGHGLLTQMSAVRQAVNGFLR